MQSVCKLRCVGITCVFVVTFAPFIAYCALGAASASSARLSSSTLTRASPRKPHWRPSVCWAIKAATRGSGQPRARATRLACHCAAAGLMWGSSPLAEAVTKSTGMGAVWLGSAALRAAMRACTAACSAGLSGPWLLPPDCAPL